MPGAAGGIHGMGMGDGLTSAYIQVWSGGHDLRIMIQG